MSSLARRLVGMRLAAGVLASLPVLLLAAWYAWSAYARLDRARSAADDAPSPSLELYQIALHDELTTDIRRWRLPARPAASPLPTFAVSLGRADLDELARPLGVGDDRPYVAGWVREGGAAHEVRVRYRGTRPWHWLGPQKSMKLRLPSGDLIRGARTFNLLNDPTPFGLEDQIVLETARHLGLLTPEYFPVRVRMNNSDMGVYRYAAQPTEGLLRRGRRIPGAIYSGDSPDIDPRTGVGALFSALEGWQQVADTPGPDGDDFGPLERLLAAVQASSFAEFAEYADESIDLERYATFDALDVVFGGDDHDYSSNHKLYFDPYRGKFEPIAWSFRGFQHEPAVNLVDHPLLVRLKMTPGYRSRRDRIVHRLLLGEASVPGVEARVVEDFEATGGDLRSDPYWDAYKLLPRVTRFHRFLLRPMSTRKWLLAAGAEMHGYARRSRYLLDLLEASGLEARVHYVSPGLVRIDVTVDGHASRRLLRVAVGSEAGGTGEGTFRVQADRDRDGTPSAADPTIAAGTLGETAVANGFAELRAGSRLVARTDPDPKRGRVRVEPEARTYSYFCTSDAAVDRITLFVEDEFCGGTTRLDLDVEEGPGVAPIDPLPSADDVPGWEAGQRSPHPWDYPAAPEPETVRLGPGVVEVDGIRRFGAGQSVVIAAGTRFSMGEGASLVFRGPLSAHGTDERPIRFEPRDPALPWGGIALLGPVTAGSALENLVLRGGTHGPDEDARLPSFLSVYDTRDVTITNARFADITDAEDVLHATYVQDLRLYDVRVTGAPSDGIDLEFTTGELRGCRVVGAGDDGLDLMGADLQVGDTVILGCTHNAVSAGEESELGGHGLFIADCDTGILAKNDSHVRVTASLVYRSRVALKTKRRDVHYEGESTIGTGDLFVAECERATEEARGSRIETGRIQRTLPAPEALPHLARQVVGVTAWVDLESRVARLEEEGG